MNMKNTNFRLKEQCKGQQVKAEQHLQLTENSNVFLLCHSIKAKVEEQCFRPQSSPIFTIPPLCPSCHVEGARECLAAQKRLSRMLCSAYPDYYMLTHMSSPALVLKLRLSFLSL